MGITKSSSFHMQKKQSVYPQAHISFSLWSVCFMFFLGGGAVKRRGWFRRRGLLTRWNEGSRHPDQWLYSGVRSAFVTYKVLRPCIAHMYYIWLVSWADCIVGLAIYLCILTSGFVWFFGCGLPPNLCHVGVECEDAMVLTTVGADFY